MVFSPVLTVYGDLDVDWRHYECILPGRRLFLQCSTLRPDPPYRILPTRQERSQF